LAIYRSKPLSPSPFRSNPACRSIGAYRGKVSKNLPDLLTFNGNVFIFRERKIAEKQIKKY
jgi:hypothetical protein